METKVLELIFINAGGKKVTFTLDDPREDLTEVEVRGVMENIITKNVFNSNAGDLAAVSGARVISRQVSAIYEAE
ncbi:MAG: DUF2922 domain-containing protein [Clostridia bacterium]|jgi:hypothetical protein|nr:DUF2922 domain-containing protein [Clostridia bacterium]